MNIGRMIFGNDRIPLSEAEQKHIKKNTMTKFSIVCGQIGFDGKSYACPFCAAKDDGTYCGRSVEILCGPVVFGESK